MLFGFESSVEETLNGLLDAEADEIAAKTKATEVVERLKAMKLRTAAELVEQKVGETMTLLCVSLDPLARDPNHG